jgi:site-specific DNA-cytosine methylase
MKVLSLFDGISCARVALERAGIPVESYYASEIEQKPIEISLNNYPDIIQLGDVTKITKDMVGDIDLICGGSPCQSFSNAGNREGFDGKSGLFYEFVRLVNKIKPKYFLLENVKMKQEWQDVISNELGVQPIEINSNLVSGQNRKRLYWTNIPNVIQPQDKNIFLTDILQDKVDEKYYLTESNIKTINRNFGSKGKTINLDVENSLIEKITYPSRINQKYPPMKSPTLVAAMGMGGGNVPVILKNGRLRKFTEVECERLQTLPDNYTQGVSSTARYKAIGNGWTVEVIAHILSFIPTTPLSDNKE